MANVIKIKRTTTPSVIPSNTDISEGELALNLADRKLFSSNGTEVFEIGGSSGNSVFSLPQNDIRSENDYEIGLSDIGKHLYVSNNAIEIPRDSDVNFPIGTSLTIIVDPDFTNSFVVRRKEYESGDPIELRVPASANSSDWSVEVGNRLELIKIEANKWFLSATGDLTEVSEPSVVVSSITLHPTTGQFLYAANADFHFMSGDFTFETWLFCPTINNTNFPNGQFFTILCTLQSEALPLELYCRNWGTTNTSINIVCSNSSGGNMINPDHTNLPDIFNGNAWNHLALTRSSNVMRFFTNGVLRTNSAYSATSVHTNPELRVGFNPDDTPGRWPGALTGYHIVKGTALYTENFTPPVGPLTPHANSVLLLNFTDPDNIYADSSGTGKTPSTTTNITFNNGVSPWS